MRRRAFTLVELLVVMVIVLLLAVAVLPTVAPALAHRQVSEAARMLQAGLVGARDRAMKDNAPRGIRFLPDPAFMNRPNTNIQASNRWVQIETAPDYTTGRVSIRPTWDAPYQTTYAGGASCLVVYQEWFTQVPGIPAPQRNEETSWFWNVRVGDKFRFSDSGRYYTVIGPLALNKNTGNPEGFVNIGAAGTAPPNDPNGNPSEFLLLVNGQDDNLDGYVDNGWDGVDNNLNLTVDEPGEMEAESWVGSTMSQMMAAGGALLNQGYTISRRPVPAQTGQETVLPSDVVIDLTTFNTTRERSRVPVDPITNYVEVMVNPNGQVVPTTSYSSPSSVSMSQGNFYHFWLAERKDVFEPTPAPAGFTFTLPMPETAYDMNGQPSGYPGPQYLTGERALVTLFPRTGNIVTNSIEFFSANDLTLNMPFYAAQIGYTEAK